MTHEDALDRLEKEIEGSMPPQPDLRLDPQSTMAVHSIIRQQLVAQYHQFAIAARLCRRVGNEAAAGQNQVEARTVIRMIADLDRDIAALERGLDPPGWTGSGPTRVDRLTRIQE